MVCVFNFKKAQNILNRFVIVIVIFTKKSTAMKGINKRCFVCQMEVSKENHELNTEVNLPVCNVC